MILKLKKERPEFRETMEGLKGKSKEDLEYLIGKENNKDENIKIEYNRITYNCPNNSNYNNIYNINENKEINLLRMYKEFLTLGISTTESSIRNMFTLHLNSLIFSLEILIDEIIKIIIQNKNNLNEYFKQIYYEWGKFDDNNNYINNNGYKKLCKLYIFSMKYFVENNNKFINDENNDLINKLKEKININININLINCDKEELANKISGELLHIAKHEDNHLICLDWLIVNFEEARQFFCKENIKYKNNLILLIKEKGLLYMELLHPYVIKLDLMPLDAKIYLYNIYVQNSYNEMSIEAELRIIIEYMFQLFKFTEDMEVIEGKEELSEIIKIKTKWLRTIIFKNVYDILTQKSICLLNRFSRIVASLVYRSIVYTSKTKNSHKWNLTLPQFKLWDGKDCDNLEDQKYELELIRREVEKDHAKFLINNEVINEINIQSPGRKCRINKLIPNDKIYEEKVLNNLINHINHFSEAIFNLFEDFKYLNKIAANYFIWYNWVENKLNKCKTEQCKRLLTIWESNKKEIINDYDCIFDLNNNNDTEEDLIIKLKNIEDLLFKKQFEIKSFIINNLIKKESKNNKNKEDLNKIIQWTNLLKENNNNNENNEWINKYWNNETINEYKEWIQELNLNWLLEILNYNKNNKSQEEKEKIEKLKLIIKREFKNNSLQEMIGNNIEDLEKIGISLGLIDNKQINNNNNNEYINKKEEQEQEQEEEEEEGRKEKEEEEKNKNKNNNLNYSKKLKNKKGQKTKNNEINNKNKKIKNKSTIKNYANLYEKLKSKGELKINEENNCNNTSCSNNEKEYLNNKFTNENEIKDELNKEKEEEEKVNEKDNQTNNDELLEECSTSFSIENNFLINENIKKENNNKIWKIKENINNCSNQNNLIEKENKNLKKKYWKINNNNNGEINQQKYFNNNDWILYESLINNNNNQLTKNLSLELIINQITNIIQKWKLIGQLLISGSYLLNVRTFESDIDCILTIPNQLENSNDLEIIYKEQYFGNYICNIEKRICEDNSFYCLLCKDYRTRSIRKIFGRVSTINIDFLGQQFDLILIILPQEIFNELNNELNKNISVKKFDEIIANFIELVGGYSIFEEKFIYLGMLLALSGYRANLRILELVNKNEKNFQLILLTIKVWSKNNFIYGTRFGFLGGTSISVLACHFILLNKNTSIIILIKSIFEYFLFNKIINNDETINNSFPLILEVNTNYQNIRKYLDWNSQNEFKNRSKLIPSIFHKILKNNLYPIWPIITPGFPTQNSNFNMNISTAKIIQKAIKLGLKKLNNVENTIENIKKGNSDLNSIKIEWQNWLNGGLFKNKYSNYLVIICSYSPLSIYGNYFCDYVSTRIRLQLLFSIEILEDIEYCHLNPKKVLNNQKCPNKLKNNENIGNNWLCNIWLVGIEFNNKYLKQQIPSLERLEGEEKLEEFSERIIKGKQVLMSEWSKEIKLFNLNVKYLKWEDISILF